MTTSVCQNKGCSNKNFTENGPTTCHYHPGKPVFHDALKGWSCCNSRVTDFDAFMNIPGCTVGPHKADAADATVTEHTKVSHSTGTNHVPEHKETARTKGLDALSEEAMAGLTLTSAVTKPVEDQVIPEQDRNDPDDYKAVPNTACRRPGCSYRVPENTEDLPPCHFHSGVPIFHEGGKGWTCCRRRVMEFELFHTIQGCKTGKHRFTKEGEPQPKGLQCRHDWYQTDAAIMLSIYSKNISREKTTVAFGRDAIRVELVLNDGQSYIFHKTLANTIDSEASRYDILSTKIELRLVKADTCAWESLTK